MDLKDKLKKDLEKSKKILENFKTKSLRASSEIPFSALAQKFDPTENAIFPIVDGIENFKLDLKTLRSFLINSAVLKKSWTILNGAILVLTEDELTNYNKIIITLDDLSSIASSEFTIQIPSSLSDDEFDVQFLVDTSACNFDVPKILKIEKDDGTVYYDSFVILSEGATFSEGGMIKNVTELSSYLFSKFEFILREGKFRFPKGACAVGEDNINNFFYEFGGIAPSKYNKNVLYNFQFLKAGDQIKFFFKSTATHFLNTFRENNNDLDLISIKPKIETISILENINWYNFSLGKNSEKQIFKKAIVEDYGFENLYFRDSLPNPIDPNKFTFFRNIQKELNNFDLIFLNGEDPLFLI